MKMATVMAEKSLALHLLEKFQDDREKIERYAAVADFCPLPAFIVRSDAQEIVYINPAYTALTGRSIDELNGTNWIDLVIHPDDRSALTEVWRAFQHTAKTAAHWHRYIHKDGTTTDCLTILERVQGNGFVGYIMPQCQEHSCPIARLNHTMVSTVYKGNYQQTPAMAL
jgi:PAS domain S-box-containing protein